MNPKILFMKISSLIHENYFEGCEWKIPKQRESEYFLWNAWNFSLWMQWKVEFFYSSVYWMQGSVEGSLSLRCLSFRKSTWWWKFKWNLYRLFSDVHAEISSNVSSHIPRCICDRFAVFPLKHFFLNFNFFPLKFLSQTDKWKCESKAIGKQSGVKWWTFLRCKLTNWEVWLCEKCLWSQ
jgi:hypothetical protein